MSRYDYLNKMFELTVDLVETDKQIAGLVNRKKQILAEIDSVRDQMVEEARNGRLDKEE